MKKKIYPVLLLLIIIFFNCRPRVGIYYNVKRGDTLSAIQNKYNVSIASIERANDKALLYPLQAGASIFLPGVRTATPPERVQTRIAVSRTESRPSARTSPVRKSSAKVENPPADHAVPAPPRRPVRQPVTVPPVVKHDINFILPLKNGQIVGYFGITDDFINRGIDIESSNNEQVIAAADGRVIFSGSIQGYGNVIFISHRNNYTTVYGNNSKNLAREGDIVKQGTHIANTGYSQRYQKRILHFEIRRLNEQGEIDILNPLDLIQTGYEKR